ncbi:eukaryotic translation initiation factor 3 subunit A isoform X2 [Corythoichthys intestinalis]|uniref:eukaryotic translation initiation factor 3 subunit A isoform X2 n=1 Tax=Corythoichthys intestinalis TaxID=161448 RepID=UPI0025A5F5A4|nr:eukaryotic translation initiation factor 3 subunit A isoform X2 [Corythoichthys intestinalis]
MDDLTTPYDDDSAIEFIDCSVCEISLRGHNLYKIHVTTSGHLKKEDAAIAAGVMVREQMVPKFQDILEYVDYLKLDEPVIGLNFLEEEPSMHADRYNIGPRYTCTLCNTSGSSPEMIHHVIGRKHRQKYIETKRPDLVTWEKHSNFTQMGKIIRTRAEIIARQDGSGYPVPMKKSKNTGKLPTKVPPWLRQNEDTLNSSGPHHQNQDFRGSHPRGSIPSLLNIPPLHPARAPSLNVADSRQTTNPWERQLARGDDWERGPHHGKGLDPDSYLDNAVTRSHHEPSNETRRGWDQPAEGYGEPGTNKNFFSEKVQLQFQPSLSDNQGDQRHWSSDKDPILKLGSSNPKPPTRNVRSPPDHPDGNFIDYRHGARQAESLSAGPDNSRTPSQDFGGMLDIPESFRRFMSGPADNEASSKRKRKSRFSDATPEEVESANQMFSNRPPDAKLRNPLRSDVETVQQGTRGTFRHLNQFSQTKQNSPMGLQMSSKHSHGQTLRQDSDFRRAENVYGREHNYGEGNWTNMRDAQELYKQGHREAGGYEENAGQEEIYSARRLEEQVLQNDCFERGAQETDRFQRGALETDRFQRGALETDRFQRGALETDRFLIGAQDTDRFQRGAQQTGRGAHQTDRDERSAQQADRDERGAQQTDRFGRGAQQADRFGRGAQQIDRYEGGAHQTDRFGRGAHQTDRFGRGAHQADRFGRGAQQADRFGRGAQQADRYEGGAQQTDRYEGGAQQTDRYEGGAQQGDRYEEGAQQGDRYEGGSQQTDRYDRSAQQTDRFGRGAQQADRFGRGAQQADRFGRGAQQADRFGRGAQQADRFGRGAQQADRFGRGAQQADRFGRGAQQAERYDRGAQQADRFERGTQQSNRCERDSQQVDHYERGAQQVDSSHGSAWLPDRSQGDARRPDRSQGVTRWADRFENEAQEPDRFEGGAQQQIQQGDLQTGSQGFYNSHLPPLDVESDATYQNTQYTNKLEKLKSTILQYMARN